MKPFTGNITYTDGSVWDATQHIVTTHRGYYYKSPYLQRHSHNSRSTIGRGGEGYRKAMDYLESVTTKALTEKPVASIAERPTARDFNVVSWHIEGFGDISVEADISFSDVIRLHLCYPKALGVIGGGLHQRTIQDVGTRFPSVPGKRSPSTNSRIRGTASTNWCPNGSTKPSQ